METKIQILEGTKSRPIIKKNVKDDTSKGNLPDNNTDLHENYYDSFSEDKTSGSEYIPSTDEDSSYNFPVTKKFKKRSKKLPKQIDKKCDNVSTTENILDTDQPSGYKPDSMQEIHISDSEQENIVTPGRQAEFLEPSSNIKIISNILLKLPTNSNTGHINEGVSAIVLAEGITESSNITSSNDNFVQISAAKHSTEGKRIRDKKHSCYYCHNLILHIGRHLEVKHANELDVARALAFPKKSDKRKELLSVITKAGDFHHNCEVMSLKQGHLILVRRPTKNEIRFNKYRDYGPCPNCLGFLLKKHLWLHLKTKCSKKDPNDQEQDLEQANKQVIAESNAILNCVFGTEFSDVYISNIVNTLRDDDIGTCCKEDTLILRFGCMLFEKYGTTQSELIRQSMRQLARLTLAINEMTIQNLKLFDLLAPQKFDLVIQGVKELCRRHQNDVTKRPEFMTPSLALKLGYSLKKCANIERGLALRQENLRRNESLLAFCNLMELEWQIRISSNALSSLFKRKLNAGQLLPVTSDLLKCNTHIRTELEKAQTALIKCSTAENWSRLAKLILCRIILFNKRRAGEASKMTLEQYSSRPSWSQQTTEELKTSLTPYELKLAERHVIVNIIGKRGRFVPVLLTQETKTGIDVLISHRGANVGIHPENPYIFARGLQTLTPLRGPDVLRKIVSEIEELEKPNLITSTKLRKYIATVCQVFSLSENEYDWLARHLGHDIRVHREFYRLHEDVVELTKVSRLLMAVDNGEASKFAGMPLKDIKLAGMTYEPNHSYFSLISINFNFLITGYFSITVAIIFWSLRF